MPRANHRFGCILRPLDQLTGIYCFIQCLKGFVDSEWFSLIWTHLRCVLHISNVIKFRFIELPSLFCVQNGRRHETKYNPRGALHAKKEENDAVDIARILKRLIVPCRPSEPSLRLCSTDITAPRLRWIHACQPAERGTTQVVHNLRKPDGNCELGHLA